MYICDIVFSLSWRFSLHMYTTCILAPLGLEYEVS